MSVTVRGADAVGEKLAGVAARLRDLTPQTSVIAADLMTLIDDSFAESRSPDGSAFAPLKSRVGTPLVNSGRLRSSNHATGTRSGLMFGTNVAYGRPHQTGTARLPKRAFLPVDLAGTGWSLMERGPAGEFWNRARAALQRFVATGEVT